MAIYRQLTLCRRIRALRVQKGLPQAVVAEHLKVSQAAYSRLEKGEVELTLTKLMALGELYGVGLGEMLEGI